MQTELDNSRANNELDYDDKIGLIVHSYNNFLAGMMGFIELAELQNEQSELNNFLTQSLYSGQQAEYFGKSLLASIGRLQVEMEDLSIRALVQSSLVKRDNINAPELIDLPEELLTRTNSGWFSDCLNEIVEFLQSNSTSHKTTVSVTIAGQTVKLKFITDDINIDEKHIANIFQPFYSSRVMQGSKGIGLAKAKGFFSQVGGRLDWLTEGGLLISLPLSR